jgi:seryl-tRNA synthetase
MNAANILGAAQLESRRGRSDPYLAFRQELFDEGLLVPTGVDGLYLRAERFEEIVRGLDVLVSLAGRAEASATYHFPLVMSRALLDRTDYVRSFPDLLGTVQSFAGDDRAHAELLRTVEEGGEWVAHLEPTDIALCSAACHPLYPSQSGPLPFGGRTVEVYGQCFRHEPSVDPARMQAFRQHEFVYLGTPEGARRHRDLWVERALSLHRSLGLDVEAVVANDPFFGRSGRMLAANQRDEALKIEIVSPICSSESPTAITSANCHEDHFGLEFDIVADDGAVAHTACVGFGVERVTLALLHTHGLRKESWPPSVRNVLGL